MPNTTFSQNNAVINMTRVASRVAGGACAGWLILMGIFGKLGAAFTSIPNPVLGGCTTLLFANIAVSGIKVMTSVPMTRRVRFIIAVSLAFGLGVTIRPSWTQGILTCETITNEGLKGLCTGAELTLTTGYAIGCMCALILHGIMPSDPDDEIEVVYKLEEAKPVAAEEAKPVAESVDTDGVNRRKAWTLPLAADDTSIDI